MRSNTAQHPQVDQKIGDTIADRYELSAQIGGGRAALFSARDRLGERDVAVKIFAANTAADALRRYAARLSKVAGVQHPALPPKWIQISTTSTPAFVAGELLQGEDLAALVERTGPLPWPRALAIFRACAEALAAVHAATGVTHGGLRPGNVWLTADGQVQVLDLGIAELGAPPMHPRPDGSFAEYRAPEQLEGAPADARSDVFSLGVLLFEAVTGTHPFTAPSVAALTIKVLMQPAPAATRVPPPVAALLARALTRAPKSRIADAGALAKELAALLPASAPVAAAPPAPSDSSQPAPLASPRPADAPAASDPHRVASAAIAAPGPTHAPARIDERRAPTSTRPTLEPMPARSPTLEPMPARAATTRPTADAPDPEPPLRAAPNERTEVLAAPRGWDSRGATSVHVEPDTRTEVSMREPTRRPVHEETQILDNPNVRSGSPVPTTTLRDEGPPARAEGTLILEDPVPRSARPSPAPRTPRREAPQPERVEEPQPERVEATVMLDADELPTRVQMGRVPVEMLRSMKLEPEAPPPARPDPTPTRGPAPQTLLLLNLGICSLILVGVVIWLLVR